MTGSNKPSLLDHTKIIDAAIDAMEDQAEAEFLERVQALSRLFPNRVVIASGGNGYLHVYLGRKENAHAKNIERPYSWQWAGKTRFVLNHGEFSEYDAPACMEKYRDYLFKPMERAENECGILYQNNPMVACGEVKFKNGERL